VLCAERGGGGLSDPGLLAAGYQMVGQHPHPPARAGGELREPVGEVVDPLEELDHHSLDAQVVSQTFSTSSASWRPSTQIRDPRATRARAPATATDPEAVRCRAGFPGAGRCGTSRTGCPSTQNPAPSGKDRVRPLRSSSTTRCTPPLFSTRTMAPTQ